MSCSINSIQKGIANFVDKYLLSQMQPTEKVIKGGLIGVYLNGIPKIADSLIQKSGLDKIGVIDENGNIDIEQIKESYMIQVKKVGSFTVEIPFIGNLTFDQECIEQLYQEIINA